MSLAYGLNGKSLHFFSDREVQSGFGEEARNITHALYNGKQPKDNIYVNVVHAVDVTWMARR